MKDARIVKEKLTRKIKKIKKKSFKRTLILMGVTMLMSLGAVGALLYNRLCFKGEVKDKYYSASAGNPGVLKHYILVKTWFGNKDFLVDEDTYEMVRIGDSYSFKKETAVDCVKINKKIEVDSVTDSCNEI